MKTRMFALLIILTCTLASCGGATPLSPTATGEATQAAVAPKDTATPMPTRTPAPTSTPNPLALGERLAICGYDLCVVSGDGSSQALGLSEDYDIVPWARGGASWSPDGSQITFVACAREYVLQFPTENCPIHVFVVNRDGSNAQRIPYEATNGYRYPTWSPDGEWIAFWHRCQLTIVHPDGSGWTDLGTYTRRTCPYGIAWSPDSQRIAWLAAESDDPNPRYLWVINSDDSGARLLQRSTEIAFSEAQIAWSPDGNSVAVQLTNGSTFLVDVNCTGSVTGCDESARTEIKQIPQDWLHTFHPQWLSAHANP